MKKAIILIGILLTVVIAMVGYYFMNKKQEGFQDQSQLEEVDTPLLDGKTEYIIKLTGVGTENNGIVRYINNTVSPNISENINEAAVYRFDDKTNGVFNIKIHNGNLFGWHDWNNFIVGINNEGGTFKYHGSGYHYHWKLKFKLIDNVLVHDYNQDKILTDTGPVAPQRLIIYKDSNNNTSLRSFNQDTGGLYSKYITKVSFIKVIKQRPLEGFYRIKINSLGTENSDNAESYVGYRADNRYVITEDVIQSTVFELKHIGDDNETFTLKNTGPVFEGNIFGVWDKLFADLNSTEAGTKDGKSNTYFKYTIFDDLYNLKHNRMMTTQNNKKDVYSLTYGEAGYKSKITFEKAIPDVKEPEDRKIYKIKLTYVGNLHESNKGVSKYIGTELKNKKPQITSILYPDKAALFFIDKNIDNTFQMFPYNKETESIEEISKNVYKKLRRNGYEFYVEDNNKIDEYRNSVSVFSYDKYSKSLRTTENTPFRMFLINNNDNVKMHGDQQPTSINHNKTLVEFEEYTPPAPTTTTTPAPTSAASGTTASGPGTETTAAAPGTTQAAPGTTQAAPGTETTAAAPGNNTPTQAPGNNTPASGPGNNTPASGPGNNTPASGTTAASPGNGNNTPSSGPGNNTPASGTTAASPGNNTPASGPGNNTPASGPETTQATVEGTTQALLGADMGVKSKVKMTPEVRDYINSELNKYTDESSLPTPEQIEQLQKIVGNNTAEELARIPNLLNKFKNNTQSYIDFHKSYEQQLEEILKTRFDAEKAANVEIGERNAVRIEKLKEEVRKYADKNAVSLEVQEQESKTNPSGSLRNIGNGTMLNFDKTGDNEHVVLNMMGHKMVKQTDGSYTRDGQGDIQGCLTFDSTNRKLGTPALSACNLDNTQSPELSFKVSKISNVEEYNKLLTKINPEIKDLASDYDTINYPFQVVEPQQAPGYCVSVDDNKVRILPCEKDSNQRYRKMHYQVKTQCGQNNNGNLS